MADVKLFVCCHKNTYIPAHAMIVPIQVGAALTEERFDGFIQDNTGTHISGKNRFYCELTAQYWAWKNCKADYYGFFHYRRYLILNQTIKRPYILAAAPTENLLHKFGYDGFEAEITAGDYDIFAPRAEQRYQSVRAHYCEKHNAEDLAYIERILACRCPRCLPAAKAYLDSTEHYFGNLYIMKRDTFWGYCEWLFPILEEFDEMVPNRSPRVDGYLAERLFGIYLTEYRQRHADRVMELPRIQFGASGKSRLLYVLLPPGTWRRAVMRSLIGK